jgi:hypothetical protein
VRQRDGREEMPCDSHNVAPPETRFSTSIALTIGYTACKRLATSTVITTIFALLFVNDAYNSAEQTRNL